MLYSNERKPGVCVLARRDGRAGRGAGKPDRPPRGRHGPVRAGLGRVVLLASLIGCAGCDPAFAAGGRFSRLPSSVSTCSGPADPQAADQDELRELEERVVRLERDLGRLDQDRLRELEERVTRLERDLGRLDRDMFLLKVSEDPAGRLD